MIIYSYSCLDKKKLYDRNLSKKLFFKYQEKCSIWVFGIVLQFSENDTYHQCTQKLKLATGHASWQIPIKFDREMIQASWKQFQNEKSVKHNGQRAHYLVLELFSASVSENCKTMPKYSNWTFFLIFGEQLLGLVFVIQFFFIQTRIGINDHSNLLNLKKNKSCFHILQVISCTAKDAFILCEEQK